MTSATINRPDAIDLSGLQPPCEIADIDTQVSDCDRPAEWYGQLPCCGFAVLVCDPHRDDSRPWRCARCQKSHDTLLNWNRL